MLELPTPISRVARPRVLLADDDAGILKAISRTLETEFDVVATVTDGRRALDTVPRLDPDVVVLDISMPGLNGFQTAEELKRFGSRAKIVFLTMHRGRRLHQQRHPMWSDGLRVKDARLVRSGSGAASRPRRTAVSAVANAFGDDRRGFTRRAVSWR